MTVPFPHLGVWSRESGKDFTAEECGTRYKPKILKNRLDEKENSDEEKRSLAGRKPRVPAALGQASGCIAAQAWVLGCGFRALSPGKMTVLPRGNQDTAPHSNRGVQRRSLQASTEHTWACWLVKHAQLPKFLLQRAHWGSFLLQKRSGLQAAEVEGGRSKLLATDGLWVSEL